MEERRIPIAIRVLRIIGMAGREITTQEILSQVSEDSITRERLKSFLQWLHGRGFIKKRTETFRTFPWRRIVYVQLTSKGRFILNKIFNKRSEDETQNGNI